MVIELKSFQNDEMLCALYKWYISQLKFFWLNLRIQKIEEKQFKISFFETEEILTTKPMDDRRCVKSSRTFNIASSQRQT